MKKKDLILILGVVLIIIIAIFSTKGTQNEVTINKPVTLAGEAGTKELSYSDYEGLVEANDPFVVVLIQTGCSHCENFEPIVEEVATEYKLPINYLNITNISSDEYAKLSKSNSYLKRNEWGTPTTLVLVGSNVVDSIAGEASKDEFVSFLKENVVMGES